VLTAASSSTTTKTPVVIQATKRGPRISTCPAAVPGPLVEVVIGGMKETPALELFGGIRPVRRGMNHSRGRTVVGVRKRADRSAAQAATTTEAAQIDCAATGEHQLAVVLHNAQST